MHEAVQRFNPGPHMQMGGYSGVHQAYAEDHGGYGARQPHAQGMLNFQGGNGMQMQENAHQHEYGTSSVAKVENEIDNLAGKKKSKSKTTSQSTSPPQMNVLKRGHLAKAGNKGRAYGDASRVDNEVQVQNNAGTVDNTEQGFNGEMSVMNATGLSGLNAYSAAPPPGRVHGDRLQDLIHNAIHARHSQQMTVSPIAMGDESYWTTPRVMTGDIQDYSTNPTGQTASIGDPMISQFGNFNSSLDSSVQGSQTMQGTPSVDIGAHDYLDFESPATFDGNGNGGDGYPNYDFSQAAFRDYLNPEHFGDDGF